MYKKHQKIIITGGIMTSLLLSGTRMSFGRIFDPVTTEKIDTAYQQNIEQQNFAEYVKDQLAQENLPPEKVNVYQSILHKVQNAKA